ncbi:uncharacterized protein [Diadema setosum]|uniref:uncharacterized protein n=1 Tax=Diadema setosum TaxID=31175 RepID=UPI003B3B030B
MLRDNLNGPNLAQFVNCSERMYLHRPKPILWVHSKTKKFQVNFSISCAEEVDCDDNPCPFSSACTNVFGGYVCPCPPGFLGKNCADGSEVQEISLPVTPNIIPLNKWNWPLIFITTSRIVWKVNVPHACAVDVRAFRRFPPDRFALVTHFRSDGSVHSLLASITTRASFFARFKMRTIWIELEHMHAFDDFTVFSNCEKELRPGCFQGLCGVYSKCLNYQNGFICDCGFGYSGTYCLHADEDTLATIRNVSDSNLDVMVCKSSQLCSRKGCGTQVSLYDHLGSCSCDKDCKVFNDCCWDYTSVCQNSNHDVSDQSGGTGVLGIGGSFGIASESGTAGSSSLSTRDVAFLEGYEIPDTVKPEYMSCLPAKVFSYNFVTRCPEDWPPFSEERTKCELLPDVNDTLTIVPVSLGGAVTFKNVYCALCHGVSPPDLTGWKVNIHCGTDVQEDETNVIMERYRRGMCTLRFDDDSVRCDTCSALRHCFASEIRTCPTHYEGLVVKEGCERFRAPFADYRKQETYENIYRNMYCFECNNPNHTSSGVETCISPTVITRAPIAGFPLTILVNFQDRNIVRVNNDGGVVQDENELCGKGQVFDVFNGVCRTISCSPGYQLLKGQCAMEVNCDTAKFSFEISYRVQNLTQCDSIVHVERVTDCLAHTVGIPVENISFVPPPSNDSIANFCFPPPADVNPFLRYKIETVLSVADSIRRIVSLTTQHESVCDGHGLQYHVICSTAHENIECSGDWSPLATAINMALKMVGDGQYLVYRRNEDGRNPAHMAVRLISSLMGFTWTVALVVPFVDVPELWYLFILLNGLQGTYVFLAFMVNVRVWNLWKCLITQTCSRSRTQEDRTQSIRKFGSGFSSTRVT